MTVIGVDIIETNRIAQTINRFGDHFLERIFTPDEIDYCNGRVPSLAARWAAKEAVAKALGTGIGDVGWRDIEIVNDARQYPSVELHGPARELADRRGITSFIISLSHTRDYAVAFVMGTPAGLNGAH
ncbi:MAG: holo-ACP synthase [Anaerolineaceae bacterium]|nr:holo-ACP synthase [Anaerolineaceae bacterium]